MSRSIFFGFGAWVGQQTGLTTCGWWAKDPATLNPPFDTTKLIASDLAKNPQAVRNGQLAPPYIQVDDAPVHGALTKIGPTWPTGSTLNSCWIEAAKYNALAPAVKPPRIGYGMACREYELTTVTYWAGPLINRRFWGFYAEITSEQGQQALCSIWPAGKSLVPGQQPAGSWWVNLATQAHPIEAGFTQIGVGVGSPKQGALFLDAPTAGNLHLSGPKLPPTMGHDPIPR
jgi:hypothetical protein